MTTPQENNRFSFALRMLIGLAAAGAVLYFMHLMSGMINNLLFAFILAISAAPLLLWLRGKGAPNWLATVVTLIAVALVVLLLVAFIANAAAELATSIPTYIDELESLQANIASLMAGIGLIDIDAGVLIDLIEVRNVLQTVSAFVGGLVGALSNAFVVVLFVVFMLVQAFTTPRLVRLEIAAGDSYAQRLISYVGDLQSYILITAVIGLLTGALDTIWFLILGIPNPLIWGGVAAILSFVPSIGFWLAAIPPTLLALLEHGPLVALITLAGILLINGFADNYIKPRYIGSGLDLAPFMVVFSVIFWAIILGPAGAILGVPMTMLVKSLIVEPDENLAWLARVSGSGLPEAETVQTAAEEDS